MNDQADGRAQLVRPSSKETLARRGLLATLSGLVVAALARVTASPVQAVYTLQGDTTNLGTSNTFLTAPASTATLQVTNTNGVVGTHAALSGINNNGNGVEGTTTSGTGVLGTATGVNGVGVTAEGGSAGIGIAAYSSGRAGEFHGNVVIESGNLNVNSGAVVINGSLTVSGGGKSAAVPHPDGSYRLLYAMESPENWFEDFGEAALVDGRAVVALDPDFAAVVRAEHYHVFLTPYGETNGLYVTRREPTGFAVREQHGGTSSVPFSYRVVARRKDIDPARLERIPPPAPPPDSSQARPPHA